MLLDDTVFDAQCSADSQLLNTSQMLACFQRIFADGQVTDRDTDDVLYLLRHTRLEHRHHTNKVAALVAGYRARLQDMEKAARQSGLTENPARQG
jgi:hypothetical protein